MAIALYPPRDAIAKAGRSGRADPRFVLSVGLVGLLAVAVRAGLVLHSRGGFGGDFGYDSGVYYSSAAAVLHGRLPYADFLLLHPPALTLLLVPFAALGAITSDHTGFIVADVAFEILGAVNAVLVVLVARRAGLARLPALVGGVFYASWLGAAGAEISIRLEPLGNLLLLVGLLLLLRAQATGPISGTMPGAMSGSALRSTYLAGAAFGVAVVTKIWWVLPLLVLLGWTLRHDGRRPAGALALGAAGAAVVVAGPFFALAPGPMWHMVVLDQLGRSNAGRSIARRVDELTGLPAAPSGVDRIAVPLALALVVALLLASAWRVLPLRPVVLVLVAQLGVLLFAPSYFGYYADFVAPGAGLVLAAAATAVRARTWTRIAAAAVVACVAVTAAAAVVGLVRRNDVVSPARIGPLAAAAAGVRCVVADSPMALVELDVLDRDLARGCPNWVDVTGRTYGVDQHPGGHIARPENLRWQRDLTGYLLSGDAVIVIRQATGLGAATRARLDRLPVIARSGQLVLRRVPPRDRLTPVGG